jgi:hypothetical protein
VEQLVRDEGVDGALHRLRERGIYLTVDEFKGGSRFAGEPLPFRQSRTRSEFTGLLPRGGTERRQSQRGDSGPFTTWTSCAGAAWISVSSSSAWRVGVDQGRLGDSRRGARFRLLKMASFGAAPAMWFSQVDPASAGLPPIFRWSERAMRWGAGSPAYRSPASLCTALRSDTHRAVVEGNARCGATPHVNTFSSSAVRAARCAIDANIDLTGAQFLAMGSRSRAPSRGRTTVRRHGSPLQQHRVGPIAYALSAAGRRG